jgi:peptidyl-tRNA hydrolase
MIEMTPLWLLTPNVFLNASDGSFLAQLVTTYDLKQDWQLLAAISVPVGAAGTEYGGIESDVAGKQLSTDLNVFAQLAWYF